MPLAIIADDLTGAMDTGLQFSKRGLETLVAMHWDHLPEADVVVIDTDSRAAQTAEARERLLGVARLVKGHTLYKKVDSTMRGNVGQELRALLEVLHPRGIVVAPAFPQEGRTTLQGIQRVEGVPLDRTFYAHDPRWPMRESHLPTLLGQQSGEKVGHVGLELVGKGVDALVGALQDRAERVVVVDALEQAHLRTIAQALLRLGQGWLPCGSAGLAEEWAEALDLRRDVAHPRPGPNAAPVLIVSGSRNEVTRSQLTRVRDELRLACADLCPQSCEDAEREIERLAQECLVALNGESDAILSASFSPLNAGAELLVSRILADATARIASRQRLSGLVLTGGDVAVATCRALHVEALRIAEEVQPGIPGGRITGGPRDGLWVVTKAGGFGDEHALLDALAYLHGRANSTTR